MKSVFIGGREIGQICLDYLEAVSPPELVIGDLIGAETPTIKGMGPRILTTHPDIIFVIGSIELIPTEILNIAPCINLHPAMLPKYRGRYSTVHAIFNGETKTGVTAHFIDDGIDSGPIIYQHEIDIPDDYTGWDLWAHFTVEGSVMFRKIVDRLLRGEDLGAKKQNESKATYSKKGFPNGGEIDWSWSGEKIYNFIRAMHFPPYEPIKFNIGNRKFKIIETLYD